MDQQEYNSKLGQVAAIMARSDLYCQYPIACLEIWIKPAIILEQIIFLQSNRGHIVGYATWGSLAEDASDRLVRDPNVILHPSEWNEGGDTWIIDMCFHSMSIREAITAVATALTPHTKFQSLRRRESGEVRGVTCWNVRSDGKISGTRFDAPKALRDSTRLI